FGEPDQVITRGHGHGVAPAVETLVRTGRGFPEGLIEAWGNLYTEFALAVAARLDGTAVPPEALAYPSVVDGCAGVGFVETALASHRDGGAWRATVRPD
ncbi:MAG: oxidoreductase, partial [Pseudomonadota bacterium]